MLLTLINFQELSVYRILKCVNYKVKVRRRSAHYSNLPLSQIKSATSFLIVSVRVIKYPSIKFDHYLYSIISFIIDTLTDSRNKRGVNCCYHAKYVVSQ